MADSRTEELLRISDKQFEIFRPWKQLCQDIAENFYPVRADFTQSLQMEDFAGWLMDDTPTMSRETLGNAIDAMLRQGKWFKVGTGDAERDQKPGNATSLDRVTSRMYSIIGNPASGFSDAWKEWDHDWVSFGAFVGSIEESKLRTHLVAKPWHIRDCAWAEDEDRKVDTMYRDLMMTARDIMAKVERGRWTGEVSQSIKTAAIREPFKEFRIRHLMFPASDLYGSDRADMRRVKHKFLSCYIDVEHRTYLNEASSSVFNYVIGRQRRLSGKPFAFSPMALNSLRNSIMLQDMALVILEQGQKAVDPPTIGASMIFTRDINMFSGGHTEVDLDPDAKLQDKFTTVETGRIDVGLELKADVRELIAEAWLLNKLTLPTLRDMRELEVQVRTDEFRRAALPFFNPIESNYHGLVLGTTFDMALLTGQITWDMFNRDLRSGNVGMGFVYESPLNQAEGLEIVREYYEAVNIMTSGTSLDKTVANIFNLRQAAEDAISRGTRPEWVIPEEQRAQADQQADVVSGLTQAAQIAQGAAGTVADVGNATMVAQQAGLVPANAA
jgi:hypothetical protein